MQKGRLFYSLMFLAVGGICVSYSSGYDDNRYPRNQSMEDPSLGNPHEASSSGYPGNRGSGQEDIAQAKVETPYPEDGFFRMGDWDFKENWRYNRDAFYRGESQPEAYREEHPYGPGGIGYDADLNYQRNLRRYKELHGRRHPGVSPQNDFDDDFLYQDHTLYYDPYHVQPYQGNYGEGSYNDAYGDRRRSGYDSRRGSYQYRNQR